MLLQGAWMNLLANIILGAYLKDFSNKEYNQWHHELANE